MYRSITARSLMASPTRRLFQQSAFSTSLLRRQGPSYQPPTPPSNPPDAGSDNSNPHRDFYKSFGRPVAKVFLMALATYQILFWSWSKLEFIEEKELKEDELKSLEARVRNAAKTEERKELAASSGAAEAPIGTPLSDAKPEGSKSWWKFF